MEAMKTTDREVFSPTEAADYLGIGRTTLYSLLAEGRVRSLKIGRLRKVRRADLDSYVNELVEEQDTK